MNKTRQLHELGQSVWLDNISRDLLTSGTLSRYINELAVTGLTSNPNSRIFCMLVLILMHWRLNSSVRAQRRLWHPGRICWIALLLRVKNSKVQE